MNAKRLIQWLVGLGLINKRPRWAPSFRGILVIISLCGIVFVACVRKVHPFLAVTSRVSAQALVVEGWVPNNAITAAVRESTNRVYPYVLTTGGPVHGLEKYVNEFQTSANVAAGRLHAAGIPREKIEVVPCRVIQRDRTYSAALALRNWVRTNKTQIHAINIVTEGVHARRSRLLFQKALGPDIKVGVLSVPNSGYDAKRWWRYSEGVKEVLTETIAYIYARLFFHPKSPED